MLWQLFYAIYLNSTNATFHSEAMPLPWLACSFAVTLQFCLSVLQPALGAGACCGLNMGTLQAQNMVLLQLYNTALSLFVNKRYSALDRYLPLSACACFGVSAANYSFYMQGHVLNVENSFACVCVTDDSHTQAYSMACHHHKLHAIPCTCSLCWHSATAWQTLMIRQ